MPKSNRKWHVEHADGSRWSWKELCELYRCDDAWFAIDVSGSLGVLYSIDDMLSSDWFNPSRSSIDMVVVWDE